MSRQFPQIILAALIILHIPTSLSVDSEDDPYRSCSALSTCGKIQGIGYPFWGINRPEYCGYPGFRLDCIGLNPVITINQQTYSILDINPTSRTLRITRQNYLQQNICPTILLNTTLDTNLFKYTTSSDTVTLYYGCPVLASSRVLRQFNCSINSTTATVVVGDFGTNGLELCNNSVVVPVNDELGNNISSEGDLVAVLREGFGVQWSTGDDSLCQGCQRSGGLCGRNTSRNGFSCYCQDRSYVTNCPRKKKGRTYRVAQTKGLTALSIAVYTTIVVAILLIFFTRKGRLSSGFWRSANWNERIETFIMIHDSLAPKRFSFSEIKKMTNMFNNKLGEGGFGSVYKGKLQDGRLVAVKVLSKSKTEGEEFINEVASISKTSHKNIVALLGFGYEGNKRALVYEYMPNGSLDKHIYREKSSHTTHHLECEALYEIAIGIARGLEYLHLGCNTRIVHLDIKPHNILLDEKFCPKISDFGLAKLCKSEESSVSMTVARGTIGYIAPEVFCRKFGGVSCKSDVYSYGMMVLEMVGGRRNVEVGVSNTSEVYFPDYIYDRLEDGNTIFDQEVITNEMEETMKKMVLVGLWCIQFNPLDRPSMTKVVEMLEGSLQSLQLPPKPFPSSPKTSLDAKSCKFNIIK